jgi:hypothetical protein
MVRTLAQALVAQEKARPDVYSERSLAEGTIIEELEKQEMLKFMQCQQRKI